VKVSGTPYEMGYAQGKLFGPIIAENTNMALQYFAIRLIDIVLSKVLNIVIPDLIKPYLYGIYMLIFETVLDLDYYLAQPYTP
jgi:hypothetical protein